MKLKRSAQIALVGLGGLVGITKCCNDAAQRFFRSSVEYMLVCRNCGSCCIVPYTLCESDGGGVKRVRSISLRMLQ